MVTAGLNRNRDAAAGCVHSLAGCLQVINHGPAACSIGCSLLNGLPSRPDELAWHGSAFHPEE